jgi:uncharacterized protein (TIGR00162 family)
MKETIIIEKKKVKLKNPVLITGLPGIGLVGRVVGRYLVDELKAEPLAYLYSPHFPHQVFMTKKGGLRLIRNSFYVVKGKQHDIIILIGDVQALTTVGQYEVASTVLDYAEKLGVKLIITVGGYSTGKINEYRHIFGATTSKKLLESFSKEGVIFGQAKGSIIGIAGLLPALAKLRNIDAICLMGETHGAYVDVTAAKNIVELLSRILGFSVDLKKLEQKAIESEKVLKKIEDEIARSMAAHFEQSNKTISYIR